MDDLIFEAKVIYYNLIINAKCCIKAVKNSALAFFTPFGAGIDCPA